MTSRPAMTETYRASDVFLHMSTDVPFGVVHLEMIASGIASIQHTTMIGSCSVANE